MNYLATFIFKSMRNFFLIVSCIAFITISQSAFSQAAHGGMVGYDPLFWKEELRLNTEQCLQLRNINAEFYKSLVACANSNAKHDVDKIRIVQLLNDRSDKILNIFSYRQRKKWDKIATTYKGNIVAAVSSFRRSAWTNN